MSATSDAPNPPPAPTPAYDGQQFQFINGHWYTKRLRLEPRGTLYFSAFAFLLTWHLIPLVGFIALRSTRVVYHRSLMLSLWHNFAVALMVVNHALLPALQVHSCRITPVISTIGWTLFYWVLALKAARLVRLHQFQVWGIALSSALQAIGDAAADSAMSQLLSPSRLKSDGTQSDIETPKVHGEVGKSCGAQLSPPWCVRNRRWITDAMINYFLLAWTFICVVYVSLMEVFEPMLQDGAVPDEDGYCVLNYMYYLPIYSISVLFTCVASPLLLWVLRPIEDTYKIKREIVFNILIAIPIYALYLVWERFFRSVAPGLSVTTPPALFFGGIFSSWIPLIDAIREHNTNAIDRNLMKTASYETSETVLRSSTIWSGSSGSARASLSRLSTTQPAVLITPSDRSWEVEEKRDDKARNTVSFSLKMVGLGKENKPLKSGVDGFYQTLSNPELYKSFREFATQDFTAECCSFYEHYTFLAEKISSSMLSQTPPQKITEQVHYASKRFALPPIPAPDTIKPNFLLMKKLFIDPGSDLELNIPSAMRAEILSTISGSNPIPMNVFDDTKNEVVYMLFSNTFEKWKAVQPRK